MPAGQIRKCLYRLGFLAGQFISWFIGIAYAWNMLPNSKPYKNNDSGNTAVIITCYIVFAITYSLHMYSYWMVML